MALTVLVFGSPWLWARGDAFNLEKEFQNYFLPAQYRGLKPDQVPKSVVESSRVLLEGALASVFRRLEVPLFLDGKYVSVPYFEYLHKALRNIDPTVHVVPSGGVVRSGISYIYNEIYRTLEHNEATAPERVLRRIIRDTAAIPAHEIRGVGSDFDTLLYKFNPAHSRALKNLAIEITNSAEQASGMTSSRHASKRAFFTIADFKDYAEQIERSTGQGGSDIDFLAFDVEGGHFIFPENTEGGPDYQVIADNLVCGYYRYLPPQSRIEDKAKQTVRGFRPLLELPFIRLLDETQLRQEIRELSSGILSPKAKEQFDKMVRNARFAGAHNRIYRNPAPSIESDILNLVLASARGRRENPLIPEFVDELPLGRPSEIPQELLTPIDAFLEKYTDGGVVYHGNPDISRGMAIMRQGLFVSGGTHDQGTAVFDRGGYTTRHYNIAAGRAGNSGLVFRFRVKNDRRLRILEWRKVKNHPWFKKVETSFPNRNLFEVLAREFGVDIIENGHVLVQNTFALEMNTSLESLLKSIADALNGAVYKDSNDVTIGLQSIREFGFIRNYQSALSKSTVDWPDTTALAAELKKRILSGQSADATEDLESLTAILPHAQRRAYVAVLPEELKTAALNLVEQAKGSKELKDKQRAITYLVALEDQIPDTQLANLLGPLMAETYAYSLASRRRPMKDYTLEQGRELVQRLRISLVPYRKMFEAKYLTLSGKGPEAAFAKALENSRRALSVLPAVSDFHDPAMINRHALMLINNAVNTSSVRHFRTTSLVRTDFKSTRDLKKFSALFKNQVADLLYLLRPKDPHVIDKLATKLNIEEWGFGDEHGTRRILELLKDEHLSHIHPEVRGRLIELHIEHGGEWTGEFSGLALPFYRSLRDSGKVLDLSKYHFPKSRWNLVVQVFASGLAEEADRLLIKKFLLDWIKNPLEPEMVEAGWNKIMSSNGKFDIWKLFSAAELEKILLEWHPRDEFSRSLYQTAFRAALKQPNSNWTVFYTASEHLQNVEDLIWELGPSHPHFWLLVKVNISRIQNEKFWKEILKLSVSEQLFDIARLVLWDKSNSPLRQLILTKIGERADVPEITLEYVLQTARGNAEILTAFAKQRTLSVDFLTKNIMPLAYIKQNRAAMIIFKHQRYWSNEIAERVITWFPNLKYEEKVFFLRKIVAMRSTWSAELKDAMTKLQDDKALIDWAKSLYGKRDCGRHLM